ncbi:MAG: hypothetical protein EXR62_06300 [Chloroflexi bacterium]|nr:hypothetical protein [Chloroflexota bacterium]
MIWKGDAGNLVQTAHQLQAIGILIQEEMVQGPLVRAMLLSRHAHLAGDQQPAARRRLVDLVPAKTLLANPVFRR